MNALNPDFPPRFKTQALLSVHFQDLPTGFENFNHGERKVVEEERVSLSQEALEEEQEAFIMSTTDREVIYVACVVLNIPPKSKEFNSGSVVSETYSSSRLMRWCPFKSSRSSPSQGNNKGNKDMW